MNPTKTSAVPKMRIQLTLFLLAILAAFAFAQAQQVPVVVSYPEDTPQSVLEDAMDAIRKAVGCDSGVHTGMLMLTSMFQGGIITHEYSIIKGFAAKATKDALDQVKALGYDALVEHDQTFDINS